ncbi:fatty acid-binding protein, intestinal [Brachyhypopomus gauderio]|uniref:fatty acid-binding protein, intestinal n=1 Tax=Brachyhypopomus gauderio TaxID=698409 RepID=UPI0040421C58
MTFNGTWKAEQSKNYEKFLDAMGFNVLKKKLGAHDNLKITLQQTGDKFHVKESSTFRSLELDFTLGVPFEYSLPNDVKLSGTWESVGDTLKGTFTRQDNGKVLNTTRQVTGDQLVQNYSYDGVEAERTFKKV